MRAGTIPVSYYRTRTGTGECRPGSSDRVPISSVVSVEGSSQGGLSRPRAAAVAPRAVRYNVAWLKTKNDMFVLPFRTT